MRQRISTRDWPLSGTHELNPLARSVLAVIREHEGMGFERGISDMELRDGLARAGIRAVSKGQLQVAVTALHRKGFTAGHLHDASLELISEE